MKFKPVNRHLQVEVVVLPQEKSAPKVLLPEDYRTPDEQYKLCRIVAVSDDCATHFKEKSLVVVNMPMIEKIKVLDAAVCLILENHVVGIVHE